MEPLSTGTPTWWRAAMLLAGLGLAGLVAYAVATVAGPDRDLAHGRMTVDHSFSRHMGNQVGGSATGMGQMAALDEADYMREMVAHHREAVESAVELSRSHRPALRALGRRIVRTQSAQIQQMRTWLADWYPDEPTTPSYQPMMTDLTRLSGDQLDCTFLRDMAVHHMAAVMMSRRLLAHDLTEHVDLAALAQRISVDQMREIHWMRARQAAWCGT